MHTTSASAPCTPPRNSHGAGTSGISIIDGGDGSSSMDLDSACTLTVAGVQRSAALAPRPSTSACSHSFSAGNDDGDQSASDSEHSARTSLSASSSPFMSLPRSFSPVDAHAIQAPIPASSDSPSSPSNEDHVAPADSTDTPPANATLTSPSISPALSQLPPTVLHELIASATSNLYIRGLPTHISDSHLFSLCSPHGHVLSAKSIVDLRTGQCKGYGFVLFARPHDAVAAMLFINKNPFVLSGPGLQASMARESFSAKLKVLQDDESANVYLSNLPLEMDEQGLVELIKPVHALSLRILVGPTGVSRGVGFARLANRDAASQVIAKLNRLTLQPGLPPLQVRFADSPAQKMLKAVTCPPPPRKGPPGPARPCAGEMPPRPPAPARSKSHPEPPVPWTQRGRMGLAPPARRIKREAASEAGNNEYANGSPSAVARSVVQSVMGSGRTSGAASVPRPSHGHGHGRHASMSGTWEKSVGNQQERGRTMHRRMQPVAALPSAHFQSEQLGAPNTHTIGTSTHNPLPTNPPTHQPPGMYFVPTPSTHDPSTGYPLPMPLPLPMTLIPPHAPDAPPMYFVAMDPSRTTLPNSTPCHIAYAAVDQYGQPLMTWAMPCAAITAPLPPAIPIPPATVAAPLSPVASPVAPPMSPPALAPWSAEANVVSSPPVGPPVLTSASSMDELTLPSMSEVTGGMTSVKEEACGAVDEQMVTKPRAKSFSVSMLMNAGGAEQATRPGV